MQAIERGCSTEWLMSFGNTGHDECIDEPIEAEPLVNGLVGMHLAESRCAAFGQHSARELVRVEAPSQGLLAKDRRHVPVGAQRSGCVTLISEASQEPLSM